MQAQSSREPHHHSHYRSIHRVSNPSYCPSMSTTVPLQHPNVTATPVIIDPEPLPTHVRSVPITSLPNRLLVNNVPMATPTFIQPPPNEVRVSIHLTVNLVVFRMSGMCNCNLKL